MKNILFIISLTFWCNSLFAQSNFQIIVATDFDGQVVAGSIDSLIKEIRRGKPVRVGWQLDFNKDKEADFDHWVDAEFITILGGHVFTQIETIFAQGPNIEVPQVEIFPSPDQWTAVIGTNGKLLNRFISEGTPKIASIDGKEVDEEMIKKQIAAMKKVSTWKVATFWAVP